MATSCAYKDGNRRCRRNGFGNPPLCRAHAIQLNLDGKQVDFPEESPLFHLLDLADRAFSRSNNDFAKQVGGLFGEFLSGAANQANAQQIPPQEHYQRPPEPTTAAPDPRAILGFEPGIQLTAAMVKARQRDLAKIFHPDKQNGSTAAMKRVNEAVNELLKSL